MRQLSSLDAQFLALESDRNYGHVGSVAILDPSTAPGGRVTIEDVRRLLGERLHLIPPFTSAAGRGPARAGPALLGARRPLRPRLPLPRDRAAAAREPGAAGRAGGPHLLPAPRSLAPPVGAVPDPRPSRRPGGAAHEDPPRRRGRHVRRRDPHAALRPLARPARRGAAARPAGRRGAAAGHGGDAGPGGARAAALPRSRSPGAWAGFCRTSTRSPRCSACPARPRSAGRSRGRGSS